MQFAAIYIGKNYGQFASDYEVLAEANIRCLEDFDIDILDLVWQVDIAKAREIVGDEVILAGNINPVLVQDKSRDEVFEMSKKLVDSFKTERFILSAGCEITSLTHTENLLAMREASLFS